jgi:hypothetical protein
MQLLVKLPQKDLSQENTMILMNWENIIVRFAEIICSVRMQNFLPLADGQVFLKQINRELLITAILLLEWNELKWFANVAIRISVMFLMTVHLQQE